MHAAQAVFFALLLAVAVWGSLAWSHARSTSIIRQWARQNGFTVLSSQRRNILRGPFFFRSDKHQTVYYVTLTDERGQTRRAWLRCGGWWFGLLSDAVRVEWDDS